MADTASNAALLAGQAKKQIAGKKKKNRAPLAVINAAKAGAIPVRDLPKSKKDASRYTKGRGRPD